MNSTASPLPGILPGSASFSVTILTLFPEIFPGPLGVSVIGDALKRRIWDLAVVNIRDFATEKHHKVDEPGFGGGPGMVMRADILDRAVAFAVGRVKEPARLVYLSPRGTPWNQSLCQQWVDDLRPVILLCGRFEGVDQRVLDFWNFEEVSLGDFVLTGGEIPAMALIEGSVRLLKGVLGAEASALEESFCDNLLEYPHYTRPRVWNDLSVPEVLLSGNHQHIRKWRLDQARALTRSRRPDLWARYHDNLNEVTLESERRG